MSTYTGACQHSQHFQYSFIPNVRQNKGKKQQESSQLRRSGISDMRETVNNRKME